MTSLKWGLSALCFAFVLGVGMPSAHAFKIGYKGLPLGIVKDFPPVHETVTSEAVHYFCDTVTLPKFQASRLYRALFRSTVASCDAIVFNQSLDSWRDQMSNSPIGNLLVGARYPDLREMAGIDANKQDATVAKYDAEVQIDAYRLYPQFHGQESSFRNVWGGDQQLGLEHLRTFTKATFYEVAALIMAYQPEIAFRNDFVAANSIPDHDVAGSITGLVYDVRWHDVLLGILFHSLEDGVSHDVLHVFDVENNRLIRNGITYGQFKDASNNTVDIPAIYPTISPDMAASMDVLSGYEPIVRYTQSGPLNLADVPQTSELNGNTRNNWFEHDGKRYQSGNMATTLSMYMVAEFLMLLDFAVEHPEQVESIDQQLEAYLDKWFSIDLTMTKGYTATLTQDIGAVDAEYEKLPWWNYHMVDLWKQSYLDDRVGQNKQGFRLPWTDPSSQPGLADEGMDKHFVVVPADEQRFDAARLVYYVKRDRITLFKSWYRGGDGFAISKKLNPADYYQDGKVSERELELDGPTRGLDDVYASIFIPAGYRACLHSLPDASGAAEAARTSAYDRRHELYRCFYGTPEGRWTHINFHLRKGTRVTLLPVDPDGDQVPFLRGIDDDLYADNCPFVANADQKDSDNNGVGDACPECTSAGECPLPDGGIAPVEDGGTSAGDGDATHPGDGDNHGGDGDVRASDGGNNASDGGSYPPVSAKKRHGGCSTLPGRDEPGWVVLSLLCLATLVVRRKVPSPRGRG